MIILLKKYKKVYLPIILIQYYLNLAIHLKTLKEFIIIIICQKIFYLLTRMY